MQVNTNLSTCSISLSTGPVRLRSEAILSVLNITKIQKPHLKFWKLRNLYLIHSQNQNLPFTNSSKNLTRQLNPKATQWSNRESPRNLNSTITITKLYSNSFGCSTSITLFPSHSSSFHSIEKSSSSEVNFKKSSYRILWRRNRRKMKWNATDLDDRSNSRLAKFGLG